jgi:AcrR family transcriptional regulator
MTEPGGGQRHGQAPVVAGDGRRARSARSRARVVDAAHAAFVERGYVGATIEGIAGLAGVSVQTVYATFGSKRALLEAVLDATIVGDHDDVPLIGRGWITALAGLVDAETAAEHLGAAITAILDRTSAIFAVLSGAAADPQLAPLLRDNRRRRHADLVAIVTILDRNGLLRDGLTIQAGADALFAVASEDVYLLLVVECGWSRTDVQRWMSDAIHRLILA